MTKALLTNINSIWGVIINPHSANSYRHIISFDNDQQKDEFISNELFKGVDYNTLLVKQPEIGLTHLTASSSSFRVNPRDYPNETFYSLLNKDFAIIEDNGEKLFYTLQPKRVGAMIEYTAELDIFFTYNITDMFNDKETRITRAMSDRFIKKPIGKSNKTKLVPIPLIKDKQFNDPMYNLEHFDSINTNNLIPTKKREEFKSDWKQLFNNKYNKGLQLTTKQKNFISSMLDKLEWSVVYAKIDNNGTCKLFGDRKNLSKHEECYLKEKKLPYAILFSTKRIAINQDRLIVEWRDEDNDSFEFENFTPNLLQSAEIIKSSYTILSNNVLWELQDELHLEKIMDNRWKVIIDYNSSSWKVRKFKYSSASSTYDIPVIIRPTGFSPKLKTKDSNNLKPIVYEKVKLDIKNKHNDYINEVKKYFSPYRKLIISSSTKNQKILHPQEFTKNIVEISSSYTNIPEQNGTITKIYNYKNLKTDSEVLDLENKEHFSDYNAYGLPTAIDAYEEFITRSKSQQNTSFLSKGVKMIGGVIGGAAMSSNPVGLLGGMSVAMSSGLDIAQQFSMRRDIKNTPDKLVNLGSTLVFDYQNMKMKPHLQEYRLPDIEWRLVAQHFYKYGYNFNNILNNINELLKSRYYFNYLEITETFENIKLQASADIKQLINDTLAQGITIWHYRDKNTFKGIKNYEYENVEMKCL